MSTDLLSAANTRVQIPNTSEKQTDAFGMLTQTFKNADKVFDAQSKIIAAQEAKIQFLTEQLGYANHSQAQTCKLLREKTVALENAQETVEFLSNEVGVLNEKPQTREIGTQTDTDPSSHEIGTQTESDASSKVKYLIPSVASVATIALTFLAAQFI